eukprot:CAMPEP_0168696654 /NCGR_PEP_ID=MMETSP0503-20121227/35479_1 /TAXON_ID=89963 /ORGANISM="Heterocapsa rotundata, Strain SCCAP K-0483" /LENGTH=59 /DNA_ID=CAMNT_0008742453 /DNA_START=21 /DNA_END=196 /DNA_ORIENTATION=-
MAAAHARALGHDLPTPLGVHDRPAVADHLYGSVSRIVELHVVREPVRLLPPQGLPAPHR